MMMTCALLETMYPEAIIIEAENGLIAIMKYIQFNPDIVFMDLNMPEMDGFESTKAIRKIEIDSGKHIPIIALTAEAIGNELSHCIQSGIDMYLTKPIDATKLKTLLSFVAGF